MGLERKTFALEELNDNFWGKVILVNIQNSTGMGGWGCLWIITSDARCYFIGFEGFPYDERKLEEFAPLFKKSTTYQYRFAAEEGGWWKYISNRKILIRKDFYDAFMKIYEQEDRWARGGYHYVHVPDVAARALGVEKLERYDHKVTESIEDSSPLKSIDCVIDNIDMFQFVRDFVKKEKDGLYYCDGHYVKNKKDESLPVKFYASNAYEAFSMFSSLWGGWNDCPEWRTVERKSKEWYEKYGAEIVKISHDSLEFQCNKKLVTEEIEQLMIEIAEFAPNSLDLADYETITDKLRREGRFVLWWD